VRAESFDPPHLIPVLDLFRFAASSGTESGSEKSGENGELGSPSYMGRFPLETKPLLVCRAVTEVKVDERLIRNPRLLSQRAKIRQCVLIESNRHLFLQALRVWILPGL